MKPTYSTSVKQIFGTVPSGSQYEIAIAVLIHYSGRFRERAQCFKRFGLLNLTDVKAHVTIVSSEGDGSFASEILQGWPLNISVTLLEMSSHHPLPKVHGYYLWLQEAPFSAQWYLRVDDDSITDVGGLLKYANRRFPKIPVHIMNSPLTRCAALSEYLRGKGLGQLPTLHEYECSLTSRAAMHRLFTSIEAMDLIRETGCSFAKPYDQTLAIGMHLTGVPVATDPHASRDFRPTAMSITGGPLHHTHYVQWNDTGFLEGLAAYIQGERRAPTALDIADLIGRRLTFGRCIGQDLAVLEFQANGNIRGGLHPNEAKWRVFDGCLLITREDRFVTTSFDTVLSHIGRKWLIGTYFEDTIVHYLAI